MLVNERLLVLMLIPAKCVVHAFSSSEIVNISQYLPKKASTCINLSVFYASDELCPLHGDPKEHDVSGRK